MRLDARGGGVDLLVESPLAIDGAAWRAAQREAEHLRATDARASASYTRAMSNSGPDYRALSVSERIQLVEDIWDSIVAENPESVQLTPAQRAELKRRLDAHDADPSSAVSWDEVRSELFQRNH